MAFYLIGKNDSDDATLTSSPSMLSTLPITSLQSTSWSEMSRTTDTSALSIYVTWNGLEKMIDGVAIAGHNLSDEATIRCRLYSWSSWSGTIVHDSGTVSAVNETTIAESLGFRDTALYFPTLETVRSVRIDISDSNNPDGYLQFRRLFAGRTLRLDSASYGLTLGITSSAEHVRAHSGTLYHSGGASFRVCGVNFGYSEDSDAADCFNDMLAHMKKRDMYISVFPDGDNESIKQVFSFSSKLDNAASFVSEEAGWQTVTLSFLES